MVKVARVLFIVCLCISFSFITSVAVVYFGDTAFKNDHIGQAKNLYTLASFLNPISQGIQRRLRAAEVNYQERTDASEETSDPKPIAMNTTPSQVLGIASCIPVLMYHYIRVNPWPTDIVGFGLSTPPNVFGQELDYYKSKGYQTITLSDLKKVLEYAAYQETKSKRPPKVTPPTPVKLPAKPLIITLDDGYRDSYTEAYPILKKHDMKAVNFVITGFVGLPNYMTWNQIAEVDKTGVIDIQSHTVNHYALGSHCGITNRCIPDALIKTEVTQSKKDLESHLGKTIDWIAYPYGSVDDGVKKLTKQAGYFGAFGTDFGSFQDTDYPGKFTLPRVRVSGGDSGPSVVKRIEQAVAACR